MHDHNPLDISLLLALITEHFTHILDSTFVSVFGIVHGFKRTSYSVLEDKDLEIAFSLNVKGALQTPLLISPLITGVVTSQPGTARKFLLCDCKSLLELF